MRQRHIEAACRHAHWYLTAEHLPFYFAQVIPALRNPLSDEILQVYTPKRTLVGRGKISCVHKPIWIGFVIASKLKMQPICSC